jgi:hypothetical protein
MRESIVHRKTTNITLNTLLRSLLLNQISQIKLFDKCSKEYVI